MKSIIIKKFNQGMSNKTYFIKLFNQKYVLRIPFKQSALFTNYYIEYTILNQVNHLQITNQLMYFNQKTGVKLVKYIENDNILNFDKIIKLFKRLHLSKLNFPKYEHLQILQKYESYLENNINEHYFTVKKLWEGIYKKHLKKHCHYPTHGDAQLNNIIFHDNKAYFIDWEFAGLNDYIYDIACFGLQNHQDGLTLLEKYTNHLTDDLIIRLYGWYIYQSLQWYLVASIKAKINFNNDFNFKEIANNFLKIAQQDLDYLLNML